MLTSYNECLNIFGSDYQINKKISSGSLYKISSGIYSDTKRTNELEIISFKYPYAVFTMDSAFYYHSLTDVIPDKYYLATQKDATKISSSKVKQYFHRDNIFEIGITDIDYQGTNIKIYDTERMLIELVRYKNKLPFDYYKEIIENYRKRIDSLDIQKLQEYISKFSRQDKIFETIELEVF